MYRNEINHLIRISKTNYYNNYFSTNKANIKNVWKGIKQIISLKPMACGLPSKILYDDVELVESKPIANAFNQFFANIGNNMAKSVPSANTSPHSYMPTRHNKSFYFFPTSSKEIEEVS